MFPLGILSCHYPTSYKNKLNLFSRIAGSALEAVQLNLTNGGVRTPIRTPN